MACNVCPPAYPAERARKVDPDVFFKSKQKHIQEQLDQYCETAARCVDLCEAALKRYCEDDDLEQLDRDVTEIHQAESDADDIRREIENVMYAKALFPESRGDILGLLEAMDRVPNRAESAIRMIANHYIRVPNHLHAKFLELMDVCSQTVDAMMDAVGKVFRDYTGATSVVGRIDELESHADGLEAALHRHIFADDSLSDLDKILLGRLTESVSSISDRAEAVGDRIRIITVKRTL